MAELEQMATIGHVGEALPEEPTATTITAVPSVMTASATPSLLLSDGGGGGGDDSGGEAETRAATLALDSKSFNIVLGCLHVAERAAFAQSNVASTVVVQKLYGTLRDHRPDAPLPLFVQFGVMNPVDLSQLRTPLTEQSVELLVNGGLGLGCCCCVPTGISFAGFAKQPLHTERELPGFLEHALSRLVVLRAAGRIQGPLPALIKRLSFHHIRVLDLEGCNVTGNLSVFSGMNINVLSLAGCSRVTGTRASGCPTNASENFACLSVFLLCMGNYYFLGPPTLASPPQKSPTILTINFGQVYF